MLVEVSPMQIILEEPMAEAVMKALSDVYSRNIMFATTSSPKSVEEISMDTHIPISTCYRRVHELIHNGVLFIDRIVLTSDGRKFEIYRSSIKDARIHVEAGRVVVEATPNLDTSNRLYNNWMKIKPDSTEIASRKVSSSESELNGATEIDLTKLRPKNHLFSRPILGDCSVCHSQYVKCHTFYNHKDQNREIAVCLDCESKIALKPEIGA